MQRLLVCVLALFLTGCASQLRTDYAGQDAGMVAVGIGTHPRSLYDRFTLLFREAGGTAEKKGEEGWLSYYRGGFTRPKHDYENKEEVGVVVMASLPPGKYEVHNFSAYFNAGTGTSTFSSREPFSIPFTVVPGQVTYLGNYEAVDVKGRNFIGMPVMAGVYFVVQDKQERDIEALRKRMPNLPSQTINAVPDVQQLNNPFFLPARRPE